MSAPASGSAGRALARQAAVYGPVAIAGVAVVAHRGEWTALAAPAAGLVLWTLGYYLVHRFVLHGPERGRSDRAVERWRWARRFDNHRYHHREPTDQSEIVFGIAETAPLFAFVALAAWAVTWSLPQVAGVIGGFAVGYLAYELLHYAVHTPRWARRPWAQRWGENHLRHHNDARTNFGTLTTLWDRVFGTLRR